MGNGIKRFESLVYRNFNNPGRGIERTVHDLSAYRIPSPPEQARAFTAVPRVTASPLVKTPCN